MNTEIKTRHIGRQISRIRELCGIKQEALAIAMGISQQSISKIESSENIKENKLEDVAKALGVTKEVILNFSDEIVLNILLNTLSGSSIPTVNLQSNFNPLDKIAELYERLIKAEKDLVQSEKDKVIYLEKLLNK